jgi:peptidyl-prolyl cis-trans isomerase B (cyclophilin B)
VNKLGIFFFIVIAAVFGTLLLINQDKFKNASTTLSSLPTLPPTDATPTTAVVTPSTPEETAPAEATPTIVQQDITNATKAVIKTSKGSIELELYPDVAPNTVSNFAKKAQSGFYKNLNFHRVEDWVVQGGDPLGNGTGGGNIPVEFNSKPFVIGSLGVASRGDGKVQNDAQFFITKKDSPHLNGAYTNFGFVTKGMDVVSKMAIGDKILEVTVE